MRQAPLIALCIFMWFSGKWAHGQHNYIYRHQNLHQVFSNPATAGSEFIPVAAVSFQKQWMGINQSPSTFLTSASYRLGNFDFYNPKMMVNTSGFQSKERVGLGLGLYSDMNGPLSSRGFSLAYAYHLNLDHSSLALGLSANLEQDVLNGTSWDPISGGDPLLEEVKEHFLQFNANLGILYSGAQYTAGLAVNHLLPLQDKIYPEERIKQDFILHGTYMFRPKENLKLEPGLHIRYLDFESLEYDIRLKAYLKHIHWMALSYHSYHAISLSTGFRINRMLYVAYHFQANLSSMISYSAGTHGIHLGMNLGMRGLEQY